MILIIVLNIKHGFVLRLQVYVLAFVESEALRAAEAPPTDVTGVWSLSCVQPYVVLEA